MARDEVVIKEDETLMKAIQSVRELINEDNLSHSFFSELKNLSQKKHRKKKQQMQLKQTKQCKMWHTKNSKSQILKYPFQFSVRKKCTDNIKYSQTQSTSSNPAKILLLNYLALHFKQDQTIFQFRSSK